MHDILMNGQKQGKHSHSLDGTLHVKQHALDIDVLDNGTFRPFRHGFSLDAVSGVSNGVHVSGAGNGLGLNTRMDTRRVHEHEHDLHAFAFFSQQIADALTVIAEAQ